MQRAKITGILLLVCVALATSFRVAAAQTPPAMAPQCVAVATGGAPAAAAKAARQHVYQDPATGATFFFSLTDDGGVRMTVRAGELDIEKTVYRDGRSRIQLRAGDDVTAVAVAPDTVDVQRPNGHGRSVRVSRAADDEWLQVKTLLAGSKALRLFRALASSLDDRTLKTPGGAAIALSDAVLGHLDGDVGALGRLRQQMRAAVQARIRPARLAEGDDCWHSYEDRVNHAMNEYDGCRHMFYWWDPRQAACLFVWTLEAESAWGQLLACSAVPLKIAG